MKSSSGSPAYPSANSRCNIDYDGPSRSADFNRRSTPVHSGFGSRNPRFSERNLYTKPRIPLSVNRAKLHVPFKSELCRLFQMGKCYYGENCHFSHSIGEVRSNPGLRPVSMKDHLNENIKLQDCHYFWNGFDCPYGERCAFLHKCRQQVKRGVGMNRVDCATNVHREGPYRNASNQLPCRGSSAGKSDSNDKLFFRKTRLCEKWKVFGNCPYGDQCTYAHGIAELREPSFPTGPENSEQSEVKSNIAGKLESKGRSYFNNWDIGKIGQIYADD